MKCCYTFVLGDTFAHGHPTCFGDRCLHASSLETNVHKGVTRVNSTLSSEMSQIEELKSRFRLN